MSELGALLRKARMENGLTLDDIQEITKIRKRYLEALESGDYSVLPGSFYVRAFVKNYSEAVGLDADEVLRLYQHEIPAPAISDQTEQSVSRPRPPRRVRSRSSDRLGRAGFNIMMWCFLILIVVVVWVFLINRDDAPAQQADNTPITDKASPAPPTDNAANGGTAASPGATDAQTPTPTPTPTPQTSVVFTEKKGRVDHYDVSPAGTHKVEIKVTGGVNWTEVREGDSSGERLTYKNLTDGTVTSYDLTDSLYINVGRADLVQITVDGITVDDGDEANSKKIQLNVAASSGGDTADTGQSATPTPTPGAGQ